MKYLTRSEITSLERIIRYLLAFMWITWLLDHGSTVVGLNMGDFFFETNPLFDKGGWLLLTGFNFFLRCLITLCIVILYEVRNTIQHTSWAMAVYMAIIGNTIFTTLNAAISNVSLIAELLQESGV